MEHHGNFMKKPSVGALVSVDPKLIVTPPKGYEAGYVPIGVAQSPQGRDMTGSPSNVRSGPSGSVRAALMRFCQDRAKPRDWHTIGTR